MVSTALGVADSSLSLNNLVGKVIAQRYIYKLSPTDSSSVSPLAIEERNMYVVGPDGTLDTMNLKTFLLRKESSDDPNSIQSILKKNGLKRTFLHIGPVIHKINHIHEGDRSSEHPGGGKSGLGESIWDSSFVTALYCAAYPEFFHGQVLELGSGVGIGGILSCISSAYAANNTTNRALDHHTGTTEMASVALDRIPNKLERLILTDINEPSLKMCQDNVQSSSIPSSRVEVASLDWQSRLPSTWHGQFNFIIASDCCYYFPLVHPLARTIAHSLAPSPYNATKNEQEIGGLFLHIGPEHRDTVKDLRKKLDRGYKMKTWTESNLVLESFHLIPLILDTLDEEDDQLAEETSRGYVEYQSMDTSRFSALFGHHHEGYDGVNADYFFPAEVGSEQ
jgi:predicted nicotinamide N-methyase